jgi:pSer/pThr/pTyr-binding forkhead associated (FHA) protein
VFCSQCGHPVGDDANFCSACGAPVPADAQPDARSEAQPEAQRDPKRSGTDDTTAGIESGALDPTHDPGHLPQLEPGTGMLVVVRGPNAGSRYLLDRDATTVGRHPDADIFLDDVTVSRNHAELLRTPDGVLVKDLGSLNGSYVGGERVEEQVLSTGVELQIGRFKLLFVGADGEAPK